jgi:two-component system sensor histidine kinase ChiS
LSPEETFRFLNMYLSKAGPHIRACGGFVDKYIGDAIMALFPNSPSDALRAAHDILREAKMHNGHDQGVHTLTIGIGIHMGPVMMGTIGEEQRFEATVISDAVNITARLRIADETPLAVFGRRPPMFA